MKRLVLVLTAMAGALVVASGVALAANITCPNIENGSFFTCQGTPNNDTINGTSDSDVIRARAGKDVVNVRNGVDFVTGGTGKDIVRGGPGDDETLTGAEVRPLGDELPTDFPDQSNDLVFGGDGSDTIYGGFGQGGKDRVFGEEGNDMVVVAQRRSGFNVRVTKEIADCGPGQEDVAYYDKGVDKVLDNCETTVQNFPSMSARQPEGMARLLGGSSE